MTTILIAVKHLLDREAVGQQKSTTEKDDRNTVRYREVTTLRSILFLNFSSFLLDFTMKNRDNTKGSELMRYLNVLFPYADLSPMARFGTAALLRKNIQVTACLTTNSYHET